MTGNPPYPICPERGGRCDDPGCGYPRSQCVLNRVDRCPHGRHPGECGQCLSRSSLFVNTLKFADGFIADAKPGFHIIQLNERREIVEMRNITDDGK